MKGIGRRMPVTMAAFLVGSLSVIGLPPCGGFISKWHLVIGTVQADRLIMVAVLLVSSILNAAYFLPVVYNAFFCADDEARFEKTFDEAPRWCLVPPVITAICSIVLFFYPQPFLQLARQVVAVLTVS
jgi:multicomponent Na+:H+ antiporter subunit D